MRIWEWIKDFIRSRMDHNFKLFGKNYMKVRFQPKNDITSLELATIASYDFNSGIDNPILEGTVYYYHRAKFSRLSEKVSRHFIILRG